MRIVQMGIYRTVKAFLIAPLIVPLVFCLAFPGKETSGDFSVRNSFMGFLIIACYALPLAYLGELLLGVPTWIFFKYYSIKSYPAFAAGGAFLGLLFYLGLEALVGNFATYPLTREFSPFVSPYLKIDIIAASALAILFRAIVFSGRPQKSPK